MKARIISGVLMAIGVVVVLLRADPAWIVLIIVAIALLGAGEWLLAKKSAVTLAIMAVALISGYAIYGLDASVWAVSLVTALWIFVIPLLLYRWKPENSPVLWGTDIILALVLLGFVHGGILLLNGPDRVSLIPLALFQHTQAALLFYVLLMGVAADVGGYFVGRYWGSKLLTPHISPKKTVLGLVGAIILCTIISAGVAWYVHDIFLFWLGIFVLLPLAVIGDLFVSWLKRVQGMKDSGFLLPGHGGILDRIDSHCATVPLAALVLYLWG